MAEGGASGDTDELTSALRARGLRVTSQREHILEAVRRLGHATPEEISSTVAGVDVTTVYRTLQLLEDLELVTHTHLGHGAPSYRPAGDRHIHVVCHTCGSVVDAPSGLADPLADRLRQETGFELDLAHFTAFGQCADCLARHAAGVDERPERSAREQSHAHGR